MSEWQRNIETRAKHTTAMYIFEDDLSAEKAQRSNTHRRRAADTSFALFCIMMGAALSMLAVGLSIAAESTFVNASGFVAAYLAAGLSLLVRGVAGLLSK